MNWRPVSYYFGDGLAAEHAGRLVEVIPFARNYGLDRWEGYLLCVDYAWTGLRVLGQDLDRARSEAERFLADAGAGDAGSSPGVGPGSFSGPAPASDEGEPFKPAS